MLILVLSDLSSIHLLCAYTGHSNRRCSVVSFGSPHARHLGLLTHLNQ